MRRAMLLACALFAARCTYNWDPFDPRLAGSADAQTSEASALDVPAADSAPCGAASLPCCAGGSCQTGLLCVSNACAPCPTGQTACGGACVDTSADNNHCGRCGALCRGMQTCTNGSCH